MYYKQRLSFVRFIKGKEYLNSVSWYTVQLPHTQDIEHFLLNKKYLIVYGMIY